MAVTLSSCVKMDPAVAFHSAYLATVMMSFRLQAPAWWLTLQPQGYLPHRIVPCDSLLA